MRPDRRRAIKRCIIAAGGLALGVKAVDEWLDPQTGGRRLRRGFPHDAPDELGAWARTAAHWESFGDGSVRCQLCPHQCVLGEGDRGFCRTRVVRDGALHTLVYGNPCSLHVDPMEKKPLYHFLPGRSILSLATAGCNLRCLNCQNWQISQARPEDLQHYDLPPERVAALAAERGVPALAYTYSEPIVYYEYTRDTAAAARALGIRNVLVTAGYIRELPLRELCRVTDAANVDLKGFSERFYRDVTSARLAPVLEGLRVMRQEGVWIEVTRLLVPGHSDGIDDVRDMCRWLVDELGPDTPLHFSRFHPAYRLQGLPPTATEVLDRAYDAARELGLRYVYVGNVPGHEAQHTICPACGRRVIERSGMSVERNLLDAAGRCPCGEAIAGVWQ